MKNLFELVKARQWDKNGIVWKNANYQAEVEICSDIYLIFYKSENWVKKQLGSKFNTSLPHCEVDYPKWVQEVKHAMLKEKDRIPASDSRTSKLNKTEEQIISFDLIYDMAAVEAKKYAFHEHFESTIWGSDNDKEHFMLFHNGRTYRGGMGSSWMYLEYQRYVNVPEGTKTVDRISKTIGTNRRMVFSTKVAFAEGYLEKHESRIVRKNGKYTTQFQSKINNYKAIVRGDDRRAYALNWYYGSTLPNPPPTPEEFIDFFYSDNNMIVKQFIPPSWEYPKSHSDLNIWVL